jgi:hypothetical protein
MGGDIFFARDRVWQASSNAFVEIIERAISGCRAGEELLVQILSDAETIRSLGINLEEDRRLQTALTERVLDAAQGKLQELLANPNTHPDEVEAIEELLITAKAHLSELRAHPA